MIKPASVAVWLLAGVALRSAAAPTWPTMPIAVPTTTAAWDPNRHRWLLCRAPQLFEWDGNTSRERFGEVPDNRTIQHLVADLANAASPRWRGNGPACTDRRRALAPSPPRDEHAAMFGSHRVVVVTPAGRARYLRLLAAHVLRAPEVDEWQLWCNTTDAADIAFLHQLASLHPRVRVLPPPRLPPNGTATIGQFFVHAIDPATLYVRMDDDVVWLEPDFFARFLAQRLADPEPFLLYPLIINNAICTWLLQTLRRVAIQAPLHPWCLDPAGWRSPELAEVLHRWFLERARRGELDGLRFGAVTAALARVSINCIAWFGDVLRPTGGVFPDEVDEEEYASVTLPLLLGRPNRITGQAIAAHFAFFPQREHLDRTDLLAQYQALAPAIALPG